MDTIVETDIKLKSRERNQLIKEIIDLDYQSAYNHITKFVCENKLGIDIDEDFGNEGIKELIDDLVCKFLDKHFI
jgi:hypothetical protein